MSGEWMKSSIAELIRSYKEQENLYNQKHKLYYNKQARNNSLKKILEAVQKNRDETTLSDITKKIQTLRTQFGQEVSKIEKSASLGGEGNELLYKPKIWWFAHIDWIGNFMKTRLDSTPLLEKVTKVTKLEKTEEPSTVLFEFEDEIDDSSNLDQFTTEIEYAEYDADTSEVGPPSKKQKTYQTTKTIRTSENKEDESGVRTIEYTLINEDDTNEVVQAPSKKAVSQFVEFHETEVDTKLTEKLKRRSKAFGKYVAALISEINDDKIFFELQRNITNSIHEAGLQQLQSRKS